MRKIVSSVLAVLTIAGMCTVSAFAAGSGVYENQTPVFADGIAEENFNGGTSGADVTINVSGQIQHRYAVEITFNNPTFTYSTGSVWDVEQHKYVPGNGGESAWSGEGSVTIVNHSDLPVDYAVEAKDLVTDYGALSIDITGEASAQLAACAVGGTPAAAALTYAVSGTPTVSEITGVKIGSVQVTISKPAAVAP